MARRSAAKAERPPRDRGFLFVVLAVLLAAVLLFGGLAYQRWRVQRTVDGNRYNGFDFAERPYGGVVFWETRIQGPGGLYPVLFFHHPRDAQTVGWELGVTDRFVRPELRPDVVYLSFDPNASPVVAKAGVEISKVLGTQYGLFDLETHGALKAEPSTDSEARVIACAQATRDVAVLSFDLGEADVVTRDPQNPFCIRIEYADENASILVADRFVYGLLRIMPG